MSSRSHSSSGRRVPKAEMGEEREGARMVSVRVERKRRCWESRRGWRVASSGNKSEREGEGEGKKKKQKNEYIFPLNFSGVPCVSSRAAPREFNSIFNLPKPPYANSVLEYLWTTLFSLLVAAFPYLTSLSASTAFISSRFLESPLRADFLPIRDRPAKRDGFLLLPSPTSSLFCPTLFIFLHVSLLKWVSFPPSSHGNREFALAKSNRDKAKGEEERYEEEEKESVYSSGFFLRKKKKKKKFLFPSSIQISTVFRRLFFFFFFWLVVECATTHR